MPGFTLTAVTQLQLNSHLIVCVFVTVYVFQQQYDDDHRVQPPSTPTKKVAVLCFHHVDTGLIN